jgi:hypothetical protein
MTRISPAVEADGLRVHCLESKEYAQAPEHIGQDVCWSLGFEHNPASLPVEIFHVIRKDDAGDLAARRQRDLKRITLRMARDWTRNRKPGFRVV